MKDIINYSNYTFIFIHNVIHVHACQTTPVTYLEGTGETWAQSGKILEAENFRLF